jgi:hypothetical protein
MKLFVTRIFEPNLYGYKYESSNRMSECIRCYSGEWMTCFYINNKMIYPNKTRCNVSFNKAKSESINFAKSGKLPENYNPI